jgi:hypothetical protein
MNAPNGCRIQDDLVSELTSLSNKLNTLSPNWVHDEQERKDIQERREALQIEIKRHRTKGHDGKRCPSFNRVAAFSPPR